jgi:hypothetical protein
MATLLKTWSTYNIRSGTSTPAATGDANGVVKVYLESQNVGANTSYIRIDHQIRLRKDISATLTYRFVSSYRANQGSYGGTYQTVRTATAPNETSRGTDYTDLTFTIDSTYHTVTHNADGTGQLYVNGSVEAEVLRINGFLFTGTRTSSFNVALPTIPRASTITATNTNIESNPTFTITRASSSYTHTLKYAFGSLSGTIATGVGTSYNSWTVPTTFYAQIPNAKTGTCTITCETYNGATLIGSTTTTFVATASETLCKPDISATIVDSNTLTTALTGDEDVFVRFISNAAFSITATPKNSATISSRKITCADGKSSTSTTGTLNAVESGTFTVETTDSRGYTSSIVYNLTLVSYIPLTLSANFYRTAPTNNTIAVQYSGNYFNDTFGAESNTLTITYKYREVGAAEWEDDATLTPTISGSGYSQTVSLGTSFDYTKKYELEIWASDEIYTGTTIKVTQIVPEGLPVFAILEDGIEVNGDTTINGDITISGVFNAETVLYDDATGSGTSVTLSETSANFTYIEIFYRDNDSVFGSQKVYSPDGKKVALIIINLSDTASRTYFKSGQATISGTGISFSNSGFGYNGESTMTATSTVAAPVNNPRIYITRVVGYR